MNQTKVGRPPHFSAQLTSHPRSPLLLHPRARRGVGHRLAGPGRQALAVGSRALSGLRGGPCQVPTSPLLSLFLFFSPLVSRSRSRRHRIYRSRCSAPGNPAPINNRVFPARA
jgi:hypothetical protein